MVIRSVYVSVRFRSLSSSVEKSFVAVLSVKQQLLDLVNYITERSVR